MFYAEIINNLKLKTSRVIMFHSGTGKDSIALIDLLSRHFDEIVCVFMYIVKNLDYEERYIRWAEKKYRNCRFIRTPHYALYSFIKFGYMGIKKDSSIEGGRISKIDKRIRELTGIEYSVYGFKKVDGLHRRLMLQSLANGINEKTNKCYPLMDMKNSEVLLYISDNNLITPFNYNQQKPSSGCDISQPKFLDYIRKKYPNDLKKIFEQFPFCEVKLFKFDNYEVEAE